MPAHDVNSELPSGLPIAIARRLEADVIALRLAPAAWLREEEVAARFRVSRSPVREAMRLLEADGLLIRHPRRGTQVAPLSIDHLDALCACRLPLEGLAAAGAADHRSEVGLAALKRSSAAMESAADADGALDANVALTGTLRAECGNPVLQGLLRQVDKQAQRYRSCSYRMLPPLIGRSVAANREIVHAVEERDAERARTVTERLIQENWDALRSLFRDGVPDFGVGDGLPAPALRIAPSP